MKFFQKLVLVPLSFSLVSTSYLGLNNKKNNQIHYTPTFKIQNSNDDLGNSKPWTAPNQLTFKEINLNINEKFENIQFNDASVSSSVIKLKLNNEIKIEFWEPNVGNFKSLNSNFKGFKKFLDPYNLQNVVSRSAEKAIYLHLNYYQNGNQNVGNPMYVDFNEKSDPIYQGNIEIKKHPFLDSYYVKLKDIKQQNGCFDGNCWSTIQKRFNDPNRWLKVVTELYNYKTHQWESTSAGVATPTGFPILNNLYQNGNQNRRFQFFTDVFRVDGVWSISVFEIRQWGTEYSPHIIS